MYIWKWGAYVECGLCTHFLTLSPMEAAMSMPSCTCRHTSWMACSFSLKLFFSSCQITRSQKMSIQYGKWTIIMSRIKYTNKKNDRNVILLGLELCPFNGIKIFQNVQCIITTCTRRGVILGCPEVFNLPAPHWTSTNTVSPCNNIHWQNVLEIVD